MSVTDNELKQHPVTRKLNKTTSPMDFLFLTAKANKQIKLIHHNFSPHRIQEIAPAEQSRHDYCERFNLKRT